MTGSEPLAPFKFIELAKEIDVTNNEYDQWTLEDLRADDPRVYLDIIIINARFCKAQSIRYKDHKVFVISEEQYNKLPKD